MEDELFTQAARKADTNEEVGMAEFDAARVNQLLDVMLKTKDYPALSPLAQMAHVELSKLVTDAQKVLDQEAKAKAEEEAKAQQAKAR